MLRKNRSWLLFAVLLFFAGCDKFEYHPYADDVSYRNLNAGAISEIEATCAGKETITFVWTGDSQRFYDDTRDMISHINRRIGERGDIDFLLHGGDLTDFGMSREFEWMHEKLRRVNVPYAALIGNHDFQGNGCHIFRKMYGQFNFSFIAGNVKFICLNTNALEADKVEPEAIPSFSFIRDEMLAPDSRWEKTVVAMHVGPSESDVQWNRDSEHLFQQEITKYPDLQFCVHAHSHHFRAADYYGDGVMYYCCESPKYRKYLVFTISPEGYDYEEVEF